jgi:hypothetical protein
MNAPGKFAEWMCAHQHHDPKFGHVYNYHSRSDAHSIILCQLIMDDLLEACPVLKSQGAEGKIAYGINAEFKWAISKKTKTIDLAVGVPITPVLLDGAIRRAGTFSDVFISCEAKAVMTEHKKSQPRLFDELGSSHEIVHQGRQDAIAAGITVVNIASTFVSPLRNQRAETPLYVTAHRQPAVAGSMRTHLLGLPLREDVGKVGFDAYCTVIVNCDNQTGCTLHTDAPAPQPGDPDHYDTFVKRIADFYTARFGNI